jgi:hypothetical protein
MDRRQLPAMVFLMMSTATPYVAGALRTPPRYSGMTPGPGGPGSAREIRRSWENHGKIALRMSPDVARPRAESGAGRSAARGRTRQDRVADVPGRRVAVGRTQAGRASHGRRRSRLGQAGQAVPI